eukprot:2627047-Karenia_brevis.AAC.1
MAWIFDVSTRVGEWRCIRRFSHAFAEPVRPTGCMPEASQPSVPVRWDRQLVQTVQRYGLTHYEQVAAGIAIEHLRNVGTQLRHAPLHEFEQTQWSRLL